MSNKVLGTLAVIFLLFSAAPVCGQKATGEIRGAVLDPSNAPVPKVPIKAVDTSTGLSFSTTSGSDGSFLVPNLLPGSYSLSVAAPGFQTSVTDGVIVETGRSVEVPVKLSVGSITQTVEVNSTTAELETASNKVATTVRNEYIKDLPIDGRDVLQFAALSAGYAGGTFNGLFQGAINVSLDGTNVNDLRYKSTNGFASVVPLRLDAIEEVTVSTSGLEAGAASGGAMSIQFSTRRGTSKFHGSLFEEVRNDAFNANDFFMNMKGLPRTQQKLNDFGGSLGGPLKLPILKNKLFFFINYEDAPVPGATTKTAYVLLPSSQNGDYTYKGTDGATHVVNVLSLAGAAGYQSTLDPTVKAVFGTVNSSLSKGSLLPISNNFFEQSINWKIPTGSRNEYPTARLDYQITDKWAYHTAWNLRHFHQDPTGPTYPGLPGASNENKETHYSLSNGVDTTLSSTLYNSFKFGIQSSITALNIGNDIHQWSAQNDKAITFGALPNNLSPLIPNAHPTIRGNPAYTYSDELDWVKGKHNLKFGVNGIYTRFYESDYYQNAGVLNYTLGVSTNDPINSLFVASNFPAIQTTSLATPAALYAVLTGRVSQVQGYQNIDEVTRQYQKFAPLVYRENYASWGTYFQDSFRVRPSLTVNYGLRWEFTGVMNNTNNTFMAPVVEDLIAPSKGPFQPGVFGDIGHVPAIAQRSITYAPDHVNPAPNFGFAWNPAFDNRILKRLAGDRKTVIRGSYGIAYFDEGLNGYYWSNTNAGNWQGISASPGSEFAAGSLSLQSPDPKFLVAPASFSPPFSEYQFAFQGYDVSTTAGKSNGAGKLPTMRNPYVQTWNFGIQRELTKSTLLEVRYVGNKTTHKWREYTIQEVNIFENGFLKEFQNAQNNLAINQAAGVISFQNRGLPGEVALPIFEAAFGANGSQPVLATGSSWTSGTFINNLLQGQAGTLAATLQGRSSPTYYCRMVGANFGPCADRGYTGATPYPMNFWVANPYVAQNDNTNDNSWGTYNALQVELRQRLRSGFTFTANYTWSHALTDMPTQSTASGNVLNYTTIRNFRLDKAPLSNDRRHAVRLYGTYQLPFGRGQRWASDNGILNRVLGNWTLGSIGTIVSGAQTYVSSGYRTINNFGDAGVNLQGLSVSQFRDLLLEAPRPNPTGSFALTSADPMLINADGTANQKYFAPWTVAGTLGQRFYIAGPWFWGFNVSVNKDVPITERIRFTLQAECLNVLNHPEFDLPNLSPTGNTFGQITSVMSGNAPRAIQLRGYIRW